MRFALDFVRGQGRRKITLGHKANIMWFSDGLFRSIAPCPDHVFVLEALLLRNTVAIATGGSR